MKTYTGKALQAEIEKRVQLQFWEKQNKHGALQALCQSRHQKK